MVLQMHRIESIRRVQDILQIRHVDLPDQPGVYAFWWISEKTDLMAANRHIVLKGPGGINVDVEFLDWWPPELAYPCLYVGKTTNIKNRFYQHIMRDRLDRLHTIPDTNEKQKAVTTSCQLRYGIEHLFPRSTSPMQIITDSVGFSYSTDFPANAVAERFYTEDRLIGTWRPWINVDSER